MKTHARVSAIDTAKGIGIALVVFGHMVARDLKPLENDWWMVWHDRLYTFHMAFFFFLSGYVFFMQPASHWPARFRKSASKLIPAYLLFALLVYLSKAAAVRVLHVDRPVQEPIDEILRMLIYPTEGFAQFLWFIYTLMMIYGLMVLLRHWVPRYYRASLAIAFLLHLLSVYGFVTEMIALQQLTRYTFFFLIAGACHRHAEVWQAMCGRYALVFLLGLAAALVALPEVWLATVAGLLSIPALVGLATLLERWEGPRAFLQFLGRNTLPIYLMNSLAMGLARALILRLWGWDGWHFFAVAPLLLSVGLLVPIAIQRLVFSRWEWSNRITQ